MNKDFVDHFWADDYFNCMVADFCSEWDVLCPHFYLSGYNGIFIMKIFGKHVISAPESKISVLSQIINRGYDLYEPGLLQTLLADSFDCYIGPAWIAYPGDENPFRSRGCAKNVLQLITEFSRQQGLIPQYRTLRSNAPAIKAALDCGYTEYASHISIRLR